MTSSKQINFTQQNISQLPVPNKGRTCYQDIKEKGLSLYVTSHGTKTFFIRKRVRGRDERIIIGSPENIPVEKARKTARIIKGQVAEGLDPVTEKRKSLSGQITFGKHFKDYMELYSKLHKKSWQYDEREIKKYCSQWFRRKLSDISKYEIQKLHQKVSEENGLYQGNRIVERLKTIYNKANEWGWEGENPAAKIKRNKEKSRERFVLPNELPCLIKAIDEEENSTARDFFWMLLLTGARRTNTIMMRWEQINWEHKTWTIPDSKNGETLVLPLVDKALEILRVRQERSKCDWVFPSEKNLNSHFVNIKRPWNRARRRATIHLWCNDERVRRFVEEARDEIDSEWHIENWFKLISAKAKKENITLPIGLMNLRLHDLRRTFGSYQAISGSSLMIIGKSLGHKSSLSTQVYARLNLDPVRASVEKATNVMLGL